jgi:hypothetical protein
MNQGVHYCAPYKKISSRPAEDYPIDVLSSVPPLLRASNPNEALPKPWPNGGLFSGPEPTPGCGYEAIYVPANSAYYINQNLRSANPPPGAIYQYVSFTREGNNLGSQPGVYWLNDGNNKYPADNRYMIRFVKESNEGQGNGGR